MSAMIERIKSNSAARWWIRYAARWMILLLAVVVYTFAVCRFAQAKALQTYEGWMEDYRLERMAIDQASAAADPYELQLQAEALEFGKVIHGLRKFGYDQENLKKLCWCMDARVRNAGYADDLISVIQQPGQWPGYDPGNEVTQEEYDTALQIVREVKEAEYPEYASTFVHARFDRDGISLMETL